MSTKMILVKTDPVTEVLKSGNEDAIVQMLLIKHKALANAIMNADFYKIVGNKEFAATEQQRVDRLRRDIERLSK